MRESIFARIADAIENGIAFSPQQDVARRMLDGPQRYSCLVGGARAGKTFIVVHSIVETCIKAPTSRHAMLRYRANAAYASLAADTLPKVMSVGFPGARIERREGGYFDFENGSQIWIGGLDDKDRVEKILGQEFTTVYINEASQVPFASALTAFTRLAQVVPGAHQRGIVDLNPTSKAHWTNVLFGDKRDPITKRPLADPDRYQRCFLNPVDNAANLSAEFLTDLAMQPDRYRKRFYEGVYVEDVEGALWTIDAIAEHRCDPSAIPEAKRAQVVIAVDPSGASSQFDLAADEIGIIVAAKGENGHGYILDDLSARLGPRQWAQRAVHAFHSYRADCIVAESNFGGEMVRATIQAADPNVPVRLVTASRGKAVRAEPVSVRYQQGQVHHAGTFEKLEDQLCAFTTGGYTGSDSPDHADAAIWALSYLLGTGQTNTGMIEFLERAISEQQTTALPAGIRMIAPTGASTLMTITGRTLNIPPSRIVFVDRDEADGLRSAPGWIEVLQGDQG